MKYRARYDVVKMKWIIEYYEYFCLFIPVFSWCRYHGSRDTADTKEEAQHLIDCLSKPEYIYPTKTKTKTKDEN